MITCINSYLGVNPLNESSTGETCLGSALDTNGNMDVLKFLVEKGVDVKELDDDKTMLFKACETGEPSVVEFLVSKVSFFFFFVLRGDNFFVFI